MVSGVSFRCHSFWFFLCWWPETPSSLKVPWPRVSLAHVQESLCWLSWHLLVRSDLLPWLECKQLLKLSFVSHVSFITAFCIYKHILSTREKCDNLWAPKRVSICFPVGWNEDDLASFSETRISLLLSPAALGSCPDRHSLIVRPLLLESVMSFDKVCFLFSWHLLEGHRVQVRLRFNPTHSDWFSFLKIQCVRHWCKWRGAACVEFACTLRK